MLPGGKLKLLLTSEVELQRKLNDARICRGKNLTECTALQTGVRIAEFRVVKDIEEFRAEGQLQPFADQCGFLDERKIQVSSAWTTQEVSGHRAVSGQRKIGADRPTRRKAEVTSQTRVQVEVVWVEK